MMLELLKSWKGAVEIDGTKYEDIGHALNACKTLSNVSSIKLYAHTYRSTQRITDALNSKSEYRVTVKQSGISEDELVFQIKISSEEAPLIGMSNESSYREVVRILKKFEPLISEFQSRLSKK